MRNPQVLSVEAGVTYAATGFAIGCLLGAVRILVLAPRVGATAAVLLEVPIILAASWCLSSIWMKRLDIGAEIRTRILVGAVAFVTLMTLEVMLWTGLFHRSIGAYLAGLKSLAGAIGFVAQLCFATFPFLDAVMLRRLNPSRRRRV